VQSRSSGDRADIAISAHKRQQHSQIAASLPIAAIDCDVNASIERNRSPIAVEATRRTMRAVRRRTAVHA
jgi:hypothetical protein